MGAMEVLSVIDWLGESPSAGIQWATAVLALIALAVALVALLSLPQILWGGPRLRIDFTKSDGELYVCLYNDLPSGRLVNMLVRREDAKNVAIFFDVREGSVQGRAIADGVYPPIDDIDHGAAHRPDIPASKLAAMVTICRRQGDGWIIPDGNQEIPLPFGRYVCVFTLNAGPITMTEIRQISYRPDGSPSWL